MIHPSIARNNDTNTRMLVSNVVKLVEQRDVLDEVDQSPVLPVINLVMDEIIEYCSAYVSAPGVRRIAGCAWC